VPPPGPRDARRLGNSAPARVHRADSAAPVVDVSHAQSSAGRSGRAVTRTTSPARSSGQIADLLERLAGANHVLAAELDAIAASRRSLSQSTVDRLEHLVEQMRPAAQIRQVLADLDPQELLAGAREWHRRRPSAFGSIGADR
jgi:hypothetical protein